MTTSRFRIGIDVGGTFTDVVLADNIEGCVFFGKELTNHTDINAGIFKALERLLGERQLVFDDLANVVHATTLVTNAIIERKGAKTALITTRGFRDTLEIGRETRYDLYDLFFEKPEPLVPRPLRLEVSERIDADGHDVCPLEIDDVEAVAKRLRAGRVESVAVCLIHGYRNPEHERHIEAALDRLLPDVPISLSSKIAPEIREYERANTVCANAYVRPLVSAYLGDLRTGLAERGFAGDAQLMLSNGGLTTINVARDQPVQLIESGPAAGAIAAGYFSEQCGLGDVISFDMGGTTAKMCVLQDGQPQRSSEFEAARVKRFKKGSGLPLKVPVIDLIEIGAGGGSIASINSMGLLKVGPESAGSHPGPIAYGRGGQSPTVTDADLLLGYLSVEYFLGGELELDSDRVCAELNRQIAQPLGLDLHAAAAGIHAIVNETMAAATRMHLAEKGKDPRTHTLIAFGGAGPMHAYGLAERLGVRQIIVPLGAGVMSALGMLAAAPAVDLARGYMVRLRGADWNAVNELYQDMEKTAKQILLEAGVEENDISMTRAADMRFVGQGFEIDASIPLGQLSASKIDVIQAGFVQEYKERYGRVISDMDVEVLTWRLHASGTGSPLSTNFQRQSGEQCAPKGRRDAHFDGIGFVPCDVYQREVLRPGLQLHGPILIEEREATTVVGPNASLTIDEKSNLVIVFDGPADLDLPDVISKPE